MNTIEEGARSRVIVAPAPLELLELAGPDRERLLHGLATGEVRNLAPGAAAHGFFTTGQGRVLADYRLVARESSFWLLLPKGSGGTVAQHLEKYKLASRVELRRHTERTIHELVGEPSAALHESARSGGVALIPDPVAPARRHYLLPEAPESSAVVETWLRSAQDDGLVHEATESETELARIEAGELLFGVDFGIDNFPQETGRAGAVSYDKGCFLGQEVVARIHYRGGVQKQPCGLQFPTTGLPAAGTELQLEGRAVGRATSVAMSPSYGAIGLGILHKRGSEPGTNLEVEGGSAVVVALPFRIS